MLLMSTTIIDLDERRRAQLGKILGPDSPTRYMVEVSSDGVITLSPAVVLATHELRLLSARPDLIAAMQQAAATGRVPDGSGPRVRPAAAKG
jgi:hypothetical protein